jgi:hypothetical protein
MEIPEEIRSKGAKAQKATEETSTGVRSGKFTFANASQRTAGRSKQRYIFQT